MRFRFALLLAPALMPAQTVTFNKQIAPVIYNNCSPCHRPGEAAPFSLLSYQDVAPKARIIAAVTSSHQMPPWKAEPASYSYRDERRLTDAQIQLIQAWVKQGMPEGKPEDRPAPPKFSSGWMLGEPDLVVEMPAGFHVPADGPDIYRNIVVQLGLTEDKWVTAIDMRPSARSVVHHVLYFGDPTGKIHQRPQEGAEPGFSGMRAGGSTTLLGGFAVGAQPHFYPDGLAVQVAKGSDLVIQYHFHPTGKPEIEKSTVALYFAKTPPERKLISVQLPPDYSLFEGLKIAPGEKDYVVRDSYTLPVDMDAVGVGAHAHYLGKKLKLTATLPNGETKTLLTIGDWDFAWQDRYFFQQSVPLPKGTRLDAEVHWDNSAENPHNPSSPPIAVTWGEQSKDEMGSVSLIGVPHEQKDYAAFRADLELRVRTAARQRIMKDPSFALKLRELMGGQ
jgi:hypothetical protein